MLTRNECLIVVGLGGIVFLGVMGWSSMSVHSTSKPETVASWRLPGQQESEDANTKQAKEFHSRFLNAETLIDKKVCLKGIQSVSVFVEISDELYPGYDNAPLKTELELKLRQLGIKVSERGPAVVMLSVHGFWDRPAYTATYRVEVSVYEFVHIVRGESQNNHIKTFASVWVTRFTCSTGSNRFPTAFLETVTKCENELLNDYLSANR